jgi:hypothetical protein
VAEHDVISEVSFASTESVSIPLKDPRCTSIRYSKPVLDAIRHRAVDQFLSIPRGGLEVGGLLFGRYVDGVIEILTSEDFPIEYSFGPSYVFSARDEETLQDRLKQPRIELDGASLELLGWWHSHTRSSIDLTEEDLRIHQKFFAGERTIALILKPFKLDPAQSAVYFPNASPDPLIAACQFSIGIPKAASPESKPSEHPVLEPASVTRVADLAPLKVEAVFMPPRKRRGLRSSSALAIVMLCAFGLFGLGFRTWSSAPQAPPQPLGLTLSQPASSTTANELILRWDRNADALQSTVGGELVIVDGPKTTRIPLNVDSISSGTLAYVRQSSKVEVRLRARSRNNELHEAVAHFVGPELSSPPPRADVVVATVSTTPSKDKVEVERMKAELLKLNGELMRMRSTNKTAESARPKVAEVVRPASITTRQRSSTAPLLEAPIPAPPPPAMIVSVQIPASPVTIPDAAPRVQGMPPPAVQAPQTAVRPGTTPLSRGRAIWTGMLTKGSILLVDGRRASAGALTGRMPSGPSRMRIYPADLAESGIVVYTQDSKQRIETPSAANGWNLTTYRPDGRRSRDITVLETPGSANNWQRVMIRADQRPVSMLVIEWEEIAR